jgi:DNA-binding transcriptional LysR family regulator
LRLTIDSRLQLAAIVLAEELHFGLAAQKLHVAVSTLSKQIAQLEDKLGLTLFNRSSKGVELTDAGRAYVEETRASLLHAEKAINAARAANEGKDYVLTAGHTPYTDLGLVLMLLSVRLPLYPRIKVQLHSDFSLDLVHSLLVGEIDLALVAWPPEMATLTLVEIGTSPLYVIFSEGHPAATREEVGLSDFARDSWALFQRKAHPLLYDAIVGRAHSYGFEPSDLHHIVTPDEAVNLVLEHAGVAFVSKAVAMNQRSRGFVMKPLAEDSLKITTYFALRADNSSRMLNEFGRAFLRMCCGPNSGAQLKLPMVP